MSKGKIKGRKPKKVVLFATTIETNAGYYWFQHDLGFSPEAGIPADAVLHGPFKTDAEADKDQELVLCGGVPVRDAGEWPATTTKH